MSVVSMLFKGLNAADFQDMRLTKPYEEIERLNQHGVLILTSTSHPINSVTNAYGFWADVDDDTGVYRIEEKMIIQGPTESERNNKIGFWEGMRSKMHALHLKTGAAGVGALVLSAMALIKFASLMITATLFVIALASLLISMRAKKCENEAANEAARWQYHPGEWAFQQLKNEDAEQQRQLQEKITLLEDQIKGEGLTFFELYAAQSVMLKLKQQLTHYQKVITSLP